MSKLSIVYRDYSFFEYRVGNGPTLYVDPVFSEFERGAWVRRWEITPCDYVLVTHAHFDHFLDVEDLMDETDAVMIAAPALCDDVRRKLHLPKERFMPLRCGESAKESRFRVEAVHADHRGFLPVVPNLFLHPFYAATMLLHQATAPLSEHMQTFVLEFGNTRVHHHGEGLNDVTDLDRLVALANDSPPDIVTCAADLSYAEDVAEAVEILDPSVVLLYPPHEKIYRPFGVRSMSLQRFEARVRARCPDVDVVRMARDSRYDPPSEW